MIDGRDFFNQTIKNCLRTYDNIQKVATGQGNDYTAEWYYPHFEEYYKLKCNVLTKEQKLDADPKTIQQINFIGNFNRAESATILFIIEEVKETILDFSEGTVKVLRFFFCFNKILT